tara:strand:+ start:5390 stop:5650 length:261 start_codon:yes stop_codon:yes gene_type:complete
MYKITIEEIKTATKVVRGDWKIIDKRPYTKDESLHSHLPIDKGEIKEVMGYTPNTEQEITTTTEVFSQTVATLSMNDVIKAINNIS